MPPASLDFSNPCHDFNTYGMEYLVIMKIKGNKKTNEVSAGNEKDTQTQNEIERKGWTIMRKLAGITVPQGMEVQQSLMEWKKRLLMPKQRLKKLKRLQMTKMLLRIIKNMRKRVKKPQLHKNQCVPCMSVGLNWKR